MKCKSYFSYNSKIVHEYSGLQNMNPILVKIGSTCHVIRTQLVYCPMRNQHQELTQANALFHTE